MTDDFLPITAIDHLELYCGNARQAAHFYDHGFGFAPVAYSGLETGNRRAASYVLTQGAIRLVLTTALGPDDAIARHVHLHGDGVAVIALAVPDAAAAYRETTARGATGVVPPSEAGDGDGALRFAAIRAFRIGIESRTRAATGILLYCSIAEHRAELVADSGINAKVADAAWGEAMATLIAEIRAGRPGNGIVQAVEIAGRVLATHFPRSHDDTNEIPDRLIEL